MINSLKEIRLTKNSIVMIVINLLTIALYLFLCVYKPSDIIVSFFHYTINNPAKIDHLFYKPVIILIIANAILLFFMLFYETSILKKSVAFVARQLENLLSYFTINTLLLFIVLYLAILFPLAIANYDLGYDEAWYLEYGINFAGSGIAFLKLDEKIAMIDTITMLPYYVALLPNVLFDLKEIWHLKVVSSLLSILGLLALGRLTVKRYGQSPAILFIFFLVIQPGFGFVASSYFGELLQAAFIMYGFYFAFGDENNLRSSKKLILSSLILSIGIHTKFQLAFLVTLTLIMIYVTGRNKNVLKLLGFVILFSAAISLIRTIPVLILDYTLLRRLILITDIFVAPAYASFSMMHIKLQLFNKFFPIPLFVVISAMFYFHSKNIFERALLYFTVFTVLWWIFLYPLTTYRGPFMGIVFLCLMAAILISKGYAMLTEVYKEKKNIIKFIVVLSSTLIMVWGYYTNLTYAYIGYNDGVQFDLDGSKNRLFSQTKTNTSQKDFYDGIRTMLQPSDTVYNGSWVAKVYLDNPVCSFNLLKESLVKAPGEKYLLVTNDLYPLSTQLINSKLDSLNVTKKIILQTPGHILYKVGN